MIDGMLFGIDVMNIQEVLREQHMTPVPLAPVMVRGLINLRGQIVTAIDMRSRLGLDARPMQDIEASPSMNVVATTASSVVSLLVDEIGDVLEVEDGLFEDASETLRGQFKGLVLGIFKLEEKLLLLLDPEKLGGLQAA